jgi:lysophospholipid acyltransferase (LPLAT)-like uncharacterized protein
MKSKILKKTGLWLMNIIAATWRFQFESPKPAEKGIIVFWHGYMLPGWYAFRNSDAIAVISLSKDGEILADLLKNWGFDFIRGSSSRGGKEVLNEIVNKASDKLILMTPDGPRGPAQKMKAGAVVAAQRAQVPLYLCGIKISHKYTFYKSWDKFALPLPFAKIRISYSDAIMIDENLTNDEINNKILELEEKLNKIY